jgi:hypothetical protein
MDNVKLQSENLPKFSTTVMGNWLELHRMCEDFYKKKSKIQDYKIKF